jgi:hypothetical protein
MRRPLKSKSGPELADAATRMEWAKAILGQNWNQLAEDSVNACVNAMLYHEWRTSVLKAKRKAALKAEPIRPANTAEKRAAVSALGALRRLIKYALRNPNLPDGLRELFPMDSLLEREAELNRVAHTPLKKPTQPDPDPKEKKKKKPTGGLATRAAQYASMTLQELGIKRATTRGKMLHKLAAAYFGDQDADLFDYISIYGGIGKRRGRQIRRPVNHLDADPD